MILDSAEERRPGVAERIDGIDALLQALSAMLTPVEAAPTYQLLVLRVTGMAAAI